MIVNWTDEAKTSYRKIILNILENWDIEIVIRLENLVNDHIKRLEQNKFLCPSSKIDPRLHKCVISKQTSLFYEINKNSIDLILFVENRMDYSIK